MTEDEAKTKWCCAGIAKDHSDKCTGSACMAWRWVQRIKNQDKLDSQMHSIGIGMVRVQPIYENTEQGYCGKAGKP